MEEIVKKQKGRPKNARPSHSTFARLPAELYEKVEKKAIQHNVSMSYIIVEALYHYFGIDN